MLATKSHAAAIKTVVGAVLVAAIVACGLSLTITLLAIRLDAAGYSARAIGINAAAGGIAALISAPMIPWAARKFGVAPLLMASLGLGGVGLLAFTLSDDYGVWLVLRFLIGFAFTAEFVLSEFWITTWAPDAHRGFAIGFYGTSFAAGFAVGPLILTWVGTSGNLPFYLGAAMIAVAAVPLALNARSAPLLEVRSTEGLLDVLLKAPAATLAALLQGAIEVAGMGLLPVYALRVGLDVTQGALFASIFILGVGVMQLPLGILADKINPHRLLMGLATFGCLGGVILAVTGVGNVLVFEGLLLVWGGIVGGLYPVGLSHLATLYQGPDLARANSGFVMAYSIGMLAGPPLVGASIDVAPGGLFWSIAGLLGLYLIIAGTHLVREARRSRSFP